MKNRIPGPFSRAFSSRARQSRIDDHTHRGKTQKLSGGPVRQNRFSYTITARFKYVYLIEAVAIYVKNFICGKFAFRLDFLQWGRYIDSVGLRIRLIPRPKKQPRIPPRHPGKIPIPRSPLASLKCFLIQTGNPEILPVPGRNLPPTCHMNPAEHCLRFPGRSPFSSCPMRACY